MSKVYDVDQYCQHVYGVARWQVSSISQSINQSNYFIVRLKIDQRAGQLSLLHLGITKTEKIELKHKTDEQISPMNSLEP